MKSLETQPTLQKQPFTPETLAEELTEQIRAVSQGFKRLLNSKIAKRTIILLIHDACPTTRNGGKYGKPSMGDIEKVIDAAISLEAKHLKKEK